jgi:copper chaperone CopZ
MERLTLNISGMTCGHCVAAVTRALEGVAGVDVEKVETGSAVLTYNPDSTSLEQIEAAVADAGYDAQPAGQAA